MLKEQLTNDIKQAMFAKDEAKLMPLRMLKSEIKNYEINKGGASYEASDEEILGVIEKQIKQRKESAESYRTGDRAELAEKEEAEIAILQAYLPEQLSENEIRAIVEQGIVDADAQTMADMGKVMGKITPELRGKADMGMVSQMVKEKLGG